MSRKRQVQFVPSSSIENFEESHCFKSVMYKPQLTVGLGLDDLYDKNEIRNMVGQLAKGKVPKRKLLVRSNGRKATVERLD